MTGAKGLELIIKAGEAVGINLEACVITKKFDTGLSESLQKAMERYLYNRTWMIAGRAVIENVVEICVFFCDNTPTIMWMGSLPLDSEWVDEMAFMRTAKKMQELMDKLKALVKAEGKRRNDDE